MTRVERVKEGRVVEFTSQEDIERVVREETQERFSAASSSPFCQDQLGAKLGYVSNTEVVLAMLRGDYKCLDTCSDTMVLLVEEKMRIARSIPGG